MIQVKQHVFFKDINWDTLARQKVCNSLPKRDLNC